MKRIIKLFMISSFILSPFVSQAEIDRLAAAFASIGVAEIDGPNVETAGYQPLRSELVTLALPEPLQNEGAISFWFKLDAAYASGPETEKMTLPLFASPGVFSMDLKTLSPQVELDWRWQNQELLVNRLRTILPSLPKEEWLHFAISWDAAAGIFNGWLNGTPLRERGTEVDPWEHTAQIRTLNIHLSPRVALAGLRISSTPLEEEDLATIVGSFRGNLSSLLGAGDKGAVDWENRKGEVIYANDFASEESLDDWVIEGPMQATFEEGFMQMQSERPDDLRKGHTVLWLKTELPEDFFAEWEMRPINDRGLCIAFFSAKGRKGESIFNDNLQPRNGEFPLYHSGDIDCYHVSYYANTPETPGRLTSNLRKNHGFYLVANGPPGISAHSRDWHKVQLLKTGARIQLAVDGRRIIDYTDDGETYGQVLEGGAFGLRQMVWTVGGYRNISIHRVAP